MGEKITRVERTTTTAATEPVVAPVEQTTTTSTTTHATTTRPESVNVNVNEGVKGATSVDIPTQAPGESSNVNING